MTIREKFLRKFSYEILSEIEKKEMDLLSWGFYDEVVDTKKDLDELLSPKRLDTEFWKNIFQEAKKNQISVDEVINLLKNENLLITPLGKSTSFVRSRFAEIIRLLARLRQRFSDGDWLSAPNLVLDVKPEIRPRAYPKRTLDPDAVMNLLKENGVNLIEEEKSVFNCLVGKGRDNQISLSHFQTESLIGILKGKMRGIVIGSGTGTGKTKAFYIPALTRIAPLAKKGGNWTKIIAIYPRVELLKDQVRECLSELRRLRDDSLEDENSLKVGIYYGETPDSYLNLIDSEKRKAYHRSWRSLGETTLVCPLVKCPNPMCGADLVWRLEDIKKEKDRLKCEKCDYTVWENDITLTRKKMLKEPPDVLFTTTEMVNRLLGQSDAGQLLGIECEESRKPLYLLLDEIHTYQGTHGANVAYLIRRWSHASRNHRCIIVGLSATLRDARRFMSELVGFPEHQILHIEPKNDELIFEGMEYNVALKGDPGSATALLSTSIQTLMLLARIMNPPNVQPTLCPAAGRKVFAFADRLDTISRLHYDLRDAEQTKHLPRLRRTSGQSQERVRDAEGQVWRVCELIGHDLQNPLDIESVSSLDPGVRSSAQVVIATASLEVGYDDPAVGAILQHKTPRDQASFIQRKGRGGRLRDMRPWTIVVLSDYGRDRWTFDHAEQIFSPELSPLYLPLHNLYIQKIQAGYAFLDWLSNNKIVSNAWRALNGFCDRETLERVSKTISGILGNLSSQEAKSFFSYLQSALHLDEDRLRLILWTEPRSILMGFLPVLWRRLNSNWNNVDNPNVQDIKREHHPMPDFLPGNLFSHLSLPDIEIRIPGSSEAQTMPIQQSLTEYAPGKVSKRYAPIAELSTSHWISIREPVLEGKDGLVTDLGFPDPLIRMGRIEVDGQIIPFFRPQAIVLEGTQRDVKDYSNAFLEWVSNFNERGMGAVELIIKKPFMFNKVITSLKGLLGRDGSTLEVSRVAVASHYDLVIDKENYRGKLHFKRNNPSINRIGLGYKLEVDALGIEFRIPNTKQIGEIFESAQGANIISRFRPEFLKHLMLQSKLLQSQASSFAVEWLWQCELTALTSLALEKDIDLVEASTKLTSIGRGSMYSQILDTILRVRVDLEEDEPRLKRKLGDLITSTEVSREIGSLSEKAILNPVDESFFKWCQNRLISTLRSAVYSTCLELLPHADEQELIADVNGNTFWVSETAIGGVGLIEELVDRISEDPSLFFNLIERALQQCKRQFLTTQLNSFLEEKLFGEGGLRKAVAQIRGAQSLSLTALENAKDLLIAEMERLGLNTDREILVTINANILRPGMTDDHDHLIYDLEKAWAKTEETLGIEIDKRVFAFHAHKTFGDRLGKLWQGEIDSGQKFNLLQNLLWVGCLDSCYFCLSSYHPFTDYYLPTRDLMLKLLEPKRFEITWDTGSSFFNSINKNLKDYGRVEIIATPGQLPAFQEWLIKRLAEPIELDYQFFYPVIKEVQRDGRNWRTTLVVKENLVV